MFYFIKTGEGDKGARADPSLLTLPSILISSAYPLGDVMRPVVFSVRFFSFILIVVALRERHQRVNQPHMRLAWG